MRRYYYHLIFYANVTNHHAKAGHIIIWKEEHSIEPLFQTFFDIKMHSDSSCVLMCGTNTSRIMLRVFSWCEYNCPMCKEYQDLEIKSFWVFGVAHNLIYH